MTTIGQISGLLGRLVLALLSFLGEHQAWRHLQASQFFIRQVAGAMSLCNVDLTVASLSKLRLGPMFKSGERTIVHEQKHEQRLQVIKWEC